MVIVYALVAEINIHFLEMSRIYVSYSMTGAVDLVINESNVDSGVYRRIKALNVDGIGNIVIQPDILAFVVL